MLAICRTATRVRTRTATHEQGRRVNPKAATIPRLITHLVRVLCKAVSVFACEGLGKLAESPNCPHFLPCRISRRAIYSTGEDRADWLTKGPPS